MAVAPGCPEPLQELQSLLQGQPNLLISANGQADQLQQELEATGVELDACVHLREPSLLEPLPLFAPRASHSLTRDFC